MHALCIAMQAGKSMEGSDITNANCGIALGYDQIFRERSRRTGRHGIKHLYMYFVSGRSAEFGRLFDLAAF